MVSKHSQYDVVVIGGGPGGSMTGTLLTDFGKSVLILEAARFPRYHVGESLLSGTADLLSRIGVLDKLESEGYIKKYGVEWVWGEGREPWTVYFKDALAMPHDYGYQVERAPFDKMLLDNAREHGAEVLEEHRVTAFEILDDGSVTVDYQDSTGTSGRVTARWIVDSSGQGGTVTKQLHQQEWDPYLKNQAVWSYWRGARRGAGIDAGNTFLPAFDDGWWWFIPLRDDVTSIGMVVDRAVLRENREQGMEAYYADAIRRTPELAARLEEAERTDEIHIQRDWSYSYDRFCGDGYIAVGDAACFIDPLFSTGVHLSMLSGFLAAVTVNTALDKPEIDRKEVLGFYEATYRKEFQRLRAQVYFLYGGHAGSKDSYFWHARSQFDVPDIDPGKAFISLIAGAFQHRSWYSRYLKELDVPVDLKEKIEGIFEGKTTGLGLNPDAVVSRVEVLDVFDDLAVDGPYLRRSRSIATPSGVSLPLSEELRQLLAAADGQFTSRDLAAVLVADGIVPDREKARGLVHEALSYGLLAPVPAATAQLT